MDENQARWPIGELARRVAAALAVGYDGPGNARVRGVPDIRSIRWYASIGLLDKPAGFRGRTALYGPRHLRQLVAVKRRQATGAPLSQIQAELAGASTAELERLARIPAALLDDPAESTAPATPAQAAAAPTASRAAANAPPAAETNFWKTPPITVAVTSARHATPPPPEVSYGLRLADGLTLLIEAPRHPTPEDHEAVLAAAQPLLRALTARGLHTTDNTGAKS